MLTNRNEFETSGEETSREKRETGMAKEGQRR